MSPQAEQIAEVNYDKHGVEINGIEEQYTDYIYVCVCVVLSSGIGLLIKVFLLHYFPLAFGMAMHEGKELVFIDSQKIQIPHLFLFLLY